MPKYDNFDLDLQTAVSTPTLDIRTYEPTCSRRVEGTDIQICCTSHARPCVC